MDGEISPSEVETLLETDDPPRVVDIRSPAAFRRGHIPGSENVPFNQLPQRVETLADADHIVTVCPHGQSSVQAARLIASYEGFDGRVESFEPGLTGWEGAFEDGDEGTAADGGAANGGSSDEGPDAPF